MTTQHTEQSERDELIRDLIDIHVSVFGDDPSTISAVSKAAALLAATPAREWVGLTSQEIEDIANEPPKPEDRGLGYVVPYARAIESKLREKNT